MAPGPYAVRLDDLVAALDRVSDQADAKWRDSRTEATRIVFAAVGATAGLLREEITRRADALPEASPVAATPTSAHDDRAGGPERVTPPTAADVKASALSSPSDPMCGAHHPRFGLRCDLEFGHKHTVRHHAEAQDTEVFW